MSSVARRARIAEINNRDLKILRGLYEARVMTAEHVAAMHFDGRYEAARKRLQKLKAAGYVGERPRRAYDPAVLFLTRRSFEVLCQRGTIADLPKMSWPSLEKRVRVSPLTLQHELEVQDVRAAFYRQASTVKGLSIERFSTWPVLSEFRAFNPRGQAVTVKPDGFIRLHHPSEHGQTFAHLFFLELDRSTETQETLVSRAHCYRDFYQRGGVALWHSRPADEFSRFPFRVLMIFKNAVRQRNTAQNLLLAHPPILSQVWLTTLPELTKDPFGPIWLRPIDCRELPAEISDPIYRQHVAMKQRLLL